MIMSKTLWIGNLESPFIANAMEALISSGKELIISADSAQILGEVMYSSKLISGGVKTWSWNHTNADYDIGDVCIDLFAYIYPDTINTTVTKRLLGVPVRSRRSFGSFRLGFGVQEELFDLFLAQYFGANELAYFDVLPSLRLLNPASQLEYRRRSSGFFRFAESETYELAERKLRSKKYRIAGPIPFYEEFSERYGFPDFVSHYSIES